MKLANILYDRDDSGEYFQQRFGLFEVLNKTDETRFYTFDSALLDKNFEAYPNAISNVIDRMYIRTAVNDPLLLIRTTREAIKCYKGLGDLVHQKPIARRKEDFNIFAADDEEITKEVLSHEHHYYQFFNTRQNNHETAASLRYASFAPSTQ